MRIKQELKLPKTPHNLWIDNKSIQEFQDLFPVEDDSVINPETCSHRHQQGWQHLQELPIQNSLNDNNNISNTTTNNINNNINNNPDEVVILASSSPQTVDGSSCDDDDVEDYQSQHSHDEEDDDDDDDSDESSSCDDEDSSISFSDTSPLLDVSSLDEDSSTSSDDSEDDDDTDMCDEDDGIPDNREQDDNVDDGFEEEEDHGCSMDTSWMSISSAASVDVPSTSENRSQIFDHRRDRNGIVLPDVLPVSVSKVNNEDFTPDGVKKIVDATLRELTLRVKKRSDLKLDPVPRLLSRDCCIVEITTQPDIQVDIRVNPKSSSPVIPISEAYVRHGSAYPARSIASSETNTKNYNSCNKTVSEESMVSTCKPQALHSDSTRESRTSAKYVGLGEGIRLNNFSIVNGFKAVSLTELVKTDDDESISSETPHKNEKTNHTAIQGSSSPRLLKREEISSSQTLPEALPNLPAVGYNIYSKENRRHYKDYAAIQQRPCLDVSKPRSVASSQDNKSDALDSYLKISDTVPCVNANVLHSQSKKVPQISKPNDVPIPLSKDNDGKLSSPEIFEVYNLETAVPHVNWTALNRISRESEWLKKRRNDREEIRRKLAMDSDNEDYVAEKLVQNQESNTIDRLKGGSNLQICFMNEAAKDPEAMPEAEPPVELVKPSIEKVRKPLPKMLMTNLLFPPSLQRSPGGSKMQNNNNTQSQVVKRQRPTFFFNRPRSWHAAKVEEKPDPEEDLFTRHHRLQAEAREALTQAKDMARMQMEIERQKKKKSPIADIVGISFPDGQNSLSRHALLDMNVAQLQVIVNDLHSQIETLNENLVKFLLERDDLHMEQDSMLVDIEDLTRYLGLKGGGSVSHSMDSKLPLNVEVSSSNNKKPLDPEPVRRSQSVHLKKPRNFM